MSKTIKEWQKEVHDLRVKNKFYDNPPDDGTLLMLVVGELSEAVEEIRKGTPPEYINLLDGDNPHYIPQTKTWDNISAGIKPEGELIELADAVMRILDYCQYKGYDLERAMEIKNRFNKTRPVMHGGKKF